MAKMIGYIRPCACCGRHGTDTPIGSYHKILKRSKKRSEKNAWKSEVKKQY